MKKELPYDKCCYYCENGALGEDDETVFCQKKKTSVASNHICRHFLYDLLKRTPQLPKMPEVDLPPLDD